LAAKLPHPLLDAAFFMEKEADHSASFWVTRFYPSLAIMLMPAGEMPVCS